MEQLRWPRPGPTLWDVERETAEQIGGVHFSKNQSSISFKIKTTISWLQITGYIRKAYLLRVYMKKQL